MSREMGGELPRGGDAAQRLAEESGERLAVSTPEPPRVRAVNETAPASMPPPPPSQRPQAQQPLSEIPRSSNVPLPPPRASSVPPSLPRPPRALRRSVEPSDSFLQVEVTRLEDELKDLRRLLSRERDRTQTEKRNVDSLKHDLALQRTQLGEPALAAPSRQQLEQKQARALEALKAAHQHALNAVEQRHAQALREQAQQHIERLEPLEQELRVALSDQGERVRDALQKQAEEQTEVLQKFEAEHQAALRHERKKMTAVASLALDEREGKTASLEREQTALLGRIAGLEAQLAASVASASLGQGDDLTRLRGIGPAFARSLAAQGVVSFSQIAEWQAEDIERLAPLIRTTPTRIRRAGWVEAAAALVGD